MKKLLILSSEVVAMQHLEEYLSVTGNTDMTFVNNADELFHELKQYKPDLVLLDFLMSENNGGSLCHQIKCNPATQQVPVILLSEYDEEKRFAAKFGCDGWLKKPVDAGMLSAMINNLLNRRSEAA